MIQSNFRQTALPYCLKKLDDGTYVVLNRNYKPIGFNTGDFLNYTDFPIAHKIKGITEKTAISLSWNNSSDTDCIFLYNDTSVPEDSPENMNNYLQKLGKLAKYKLSS